ncbi:MAG: hypothetical protein IM669_10205 [Phenylobacterium sp.]|jgi:hypothetical protein|uniref:hypothetical protein n=1 Tax=Phenylobacterium sp. TaxID=1871053 RepID=UPI0021798B1C|nr:hypothetical protein [Phenylobacterium sp.]MCA3260090.1 hypothetical protein [Rubrivivax sp.]MCA3757881.1 hypothetical protein [Phenylobacterium sp.]
MREELDTLIIDWSDFEAAGRVTRDLARRLAADKETLRGLVDAVPHTPALMQKCERHELLDYLVLYDALDRGFRIRLHASTAVHRERPHDHRFSFSTYIVRGGYAHTTHLVEAPLYEDAATDKRSWLSRASPDPRHDIVSDQIRPLITRCEQAGDSYSLHHSAVHTTVTTPDTISVFVRGPAEKTDSLIFDRDTGRYWWRFGAHEEPDERRESKKMTHDEYEAFRRRMLDLGVI